MWSIWFLDVVNSNISLFVVCGAFFLWDKVIHRCFSIAAVVFSLLETSGFGECLQWAPAERTIFILWKSCRRSPCVLTRVNASYNKAHSERLTSEFSVAIHLWCRSKSWSENHLFCVRAVEHLFGWNSIKFLWLRETLDRVKLVSCG